MPERDSEAQDEDEEEKLGWSNVTDLSLVVTQGNSETGHHLIKNQYTFIFVTDCPQRI